MKKMTIDEILALQLLGIESVKIIRQDKYVLTILDSDGGMRALDTATEILDQQEDQGVVTLAYDDDDFPHQFREIGCDCPPLIHLLGDKGLLKSDNAVAIIGSRKASAAGNAAAYRLGRHFAELGRVVVSGLALGCDTSAHEGCLSVDGATIAIVATGLDRVHPKENVDLQQRILDSGKGLILSEQPFSVKANPSRLVARNRLQAAISETVVVAECPLQSGTMHTVRFAQQYHKFIMSYDFGHFTPMSSGNEYVIKSKIGQSITV